MAASVPSAGSSSDVVLVRLAQVVADAAGVAQVNHIFIGELDFNKSLVFQLRSGPLIYENRAQNI